MGSLPGAVVAGLLVGVVFSMTALLAPELAELSIFVLMAVVLLIRPQGFFGRRRADGLSGMAAPAERTARPAGARAARRVRRRHRVLGSCWCSLRCSCPPRRSTLADTFGLYRGRLQPAVRLHRPAVLRPRRLPRRRQLHHRHRHRPVGLPWWAAILAGASRARSWPVSWACWRSAPAASTSPWSRWRCRNRLLRLLQGRADWTGGENGLRGVNLRTVELPFGWFSTSSTRAEYYVCRRLRRASLWPPSRACSPRRSGPRWRRSARTRRGPAPAASMCARHALVFVLSAAVCGLAGGAARAPPVDRPRSRRCITCSRAWP